MSGRKKSLPRDVFPPVSIDQSWIAEQLPGGSGRALDVGGARGDLGVLLRDRGWEYVNLDPVATGPGAVIGDAHCLPFDDESFDLVVASDMLHVLPDPQIAVGEMRRVMRPGGQLVLWVPFVHPFLGDYYRFTARGLSHSLRGAGLAVGSIEAPLGPVTVVGTMLAMVLARLRLRAASAAVRRAFIRLDLRLPQSLPDGGYAAGYLVSAARPAEREGGPAEAEAVVMRPVRA